MTICDETFKTLARTKHEDETFFKPLRQQTGEACGEFGDYVNSFSPNEELASAVKKVLEKRRTIRLGEAFGNRTQRMRIIDANKEHR